ncbi:MAG TPA: Mu-like prophage major head subunit gpT family protein [Aliarcobacter sp.]|nr:Mu-like prophage major head subunit gpT family protein [Aliarcobacter sp.]
MPQHKIVKKLTGLNVERKLTVDKKIINEETRTVPFILISRNNEGERYDWWKDEIYIEKLDVNGANYERLNTFFKDHIRSVDSAIGRVENIRVENGELKADVIFGTDEESEKIFRKYVEGILTDCSIGYKINSLTVEERKGEPTIVTATSFEIRELSAVGIGFDSGATVGREKEIIGDKLMNEELRAELLELRKSIDELNETQKVRLEELEKLEKRKDTNTPTVDVSQVANNAIAEERQRAAEINNLVIAGELTQERATTHITVGDSIDMVRKAILDERVKKSQVVVSNGEDRNALKRSMEDAILMRVGFTPKTVADGADNFRGASLLDMARAITGYEGFDRQELAKRAMSTSDFPLLLGNVANRVVAAAFEEEEGTFAIWTQAVELPDFRTRNEISFKNQNGRLQKLAGEKSEKKKIEFDENGLGWKLESYGASFSLTREMIINDDLGAFVNIVAEFGRMAKRTSNGIVYDILQNKGSYANYKMNDDKTIFDASHKNVSTTGAALGTETLSAARVLMKRQKDGEKALNISPKYLLVAPEQETKALQLLNSESDVNSTNSGVKNPHKNTLIPIVDSELEAGPWFMAAANNTIKVGYLQGTNKQPVVEQKNSDIDGAEFKCVFDFGVVVTDHRGLYKNLGA